MTARCLNCRWKHAESKGWTRTWLCARFKHDQIDRINGEPEAPYKPYWKVLEISAVNHLAPCEFHEPERDAPEMVVKHGSAKLKVAQ